MCWWVSVPSWLHRLSAAVRGSLTVLPSGLCHTSHSPAWVLWCGWRPVHTVHTSVVSHVRASWSLYSSRCLAGYSYIICSPRSPAANNGSSVYCPGNGLLYPCPPGVYGIVGGLNSSSCTGSCSPGYTCPSGSTNSTAGPCGGVNSCVSRYPSSPAFHALRCHLWYLCCFIVVVLVIVESRPHFSCVIAGIVPLGVARPHLCPSATSLRPHQPR